MKQVCTISAALVLAAVYAPPALAQKTGELVSQAIEAQGGAAALRALKGLAIKGSAKHWEPEQSKVVDGEPRFLGDSTFAMTWDLGNGMARTEWTRAMQYPAVETLKYTEVVTPAAGYVITGNQTAAMSGIRVAAQLRELERASPTLLLKAMDDGGNVGSVDPQALGEDSLPAVSYTDGGTKFTILFDKATHLPAAIRTRDEDNVHGDSNYDLVLGDWKALGDAKVAHSLSYRLDGVEVAKVTYTDLTPNPAIPADTFAISDAVKSAAKGPAKSDVPYQWVLRRIFLGRFIDSDAMFVPAGGSLKLVEITPDVQQVVGGSHNNLIVAMQDFLVVFDAPIGEGQSRWVIDAAKAKYPGKPIKYVVLTHHHMDHTGGTRTYVAEGATVVVPAPTKAHWEKMLRMPRTIIPDAQQKAPKEVNVVEVKDTMSIKDDSGEIRLHIIANPHVEGMIIGHVVKPNVVWVTDIWSPVRDKTKTAGSIAFAQALNELGISGATLVGGHGAYGKQSDLEAVVAQQ
jgi:glyoxylase-like metal-dependent hydrolase (beta-lactamase superfamily II)